MTNLNPISRVFNRMDKLREQEKFYNNLKASLPERVIPDYKTAVDETLKNISDRKRKLIDLYYIKGKTLEEIGKSMHICHERVRQLTSTVFCDFPWLIVNKSIKQYKRALNKDKKYYKYNKKKMEKILENEYNFNKKLLRLPIDALCLSKQPYDSLKEQDNLTIDDVIKNKDELAIYRAVGTIYLKEIKSRLKEYGFEI